MTAPTPVALAASSTALAAAHGPQITSQLADQMVRRVEGGSTHFDIALNPEGLGQVNVTVQIDAAGRLTAQLSFDNPAAAAEARTRAGDLQQALSQAGIDVAQGGLSFQSGAQDQGLAGQQGGGGSGSRGAFASPLADTTDDLTPATNSAVSRRASGGIDITI